MPTDIGATPKTSYLAVVRKSDWLDADPRSSPKPRDGDRITSIKKLYGYPAGSQGVDLYVDNVHASGSNAGAFSHWTMTLVDREARD